MSQFEKYAKVIGLEMWQELKKVNRSKNTAVHFQGILYWNILKVCHLSNLVKSTKKRSIRALLEIKFQCHMCHIFP